MSRHNTPHYARSTHAVIAFALVLTAATSAHAELHPRLNGAAAYDDVLDITWLTDAGLSGNRSWDEQLAWIDGLNAANHLGFDDWRIASLSVEAGLPTGMTESVADCSTIWAPLCQDNELGYMFYYNLGGELSSDLTGERTVGDVTLSNIQNVYWSATEYAASTAWIFHFDSGFQVWSPKGGLRYAWAVRSGDVPDSDGDGVADPADNCTLRSNTNQRDTNGDSIGNACDADLTDDCQVNFADLALFRASFLPNPYNPDADFDGDGVVGFVDIAILKSTFFTSPDAGPGPSGLPNDCS